MVTVMFIKLMFCKIEFLHSGEAVTHFIDGTHYGAQPHYTDAYIALARRLGYDDVESYCQEHEFMHNFIAEEVFGEPSRVLWALAHGKKAATKDILAEEALSIHFQAFLRNDWIMPATAPGVDWWALRDKAKELLQI
jgi:hypothetical protein